MLKLEEFGEKRVQLSTRGAEVLTSEPGPPQPSPLPCLLRPTPGEESVWASWQRLTHCESVSVPRIIPCPENLVNARGLCNPGCHWDYSVTASLDTPLRRIRSRSFLPSPLASKPLHFHVYSPESRHRAGLWPPTPLFNSGIFSFTHGISWFPLPPSQPRDNRKMKAPDSPCCHLSITTFNPQTALGSSCPRGGSERQGEAAHGQAPTGVSISPRPHRRTTPPPPRLISEYGFLPSSDVGELSSPSSDPVFNPDGTKALGGLMEGWKEHWTRPWETQGQISAHLPLRSVTLGKLPNPFGPQYCWPNKGGHTSIRAPFQGRGGLSVSQDATLWPCRGHRREFVPWELTVPVKCLPLSAHLGHWTFQGSSHHDLEVEARRTARD